MKQKVHELMKSASINQMIDAMQQMAVELEITLVCPSAIADWIVDTFDEEEQKEITAEIKQAKEVKKRIC